METELLRDGSICVPKINQRGTFANVRFFHLADKDRMIASVACLPQTAFDTGESTRKYGNAFDPGPDLDITEFIIQRSGETLRQMHLRFVQNVYDKGIGLSESIMAHRCFFDTNEHQRRVERDRAKSRHGNAVRIAGRVLCRDNAYAAGEAGKRISKFVF